MVSDPEFMKAALGKAREAERLGEVPVGAVVVLGGRIIAEGCNRNGVDHDPSAHAEMVAMREAGKKLGNHRLGQCELFVTMEPCAMCAGAAVHARLARLVYGADDPKTGAVRSVLQLINHPSSNHKMIVTSGVMATECGELVQSFFRKRRSEKKL